MRLHRLDLNLLVALDALLEESSVSRAADRLFITQPAMSNALGRLRKHFADELITQVGRRMLLTERGEQLRTEVRAILLRIQQVTEPMDPFDPTVSSKSFRICASDYFSMVALPSLIRYLSVHAPQVSVEVQPLTARLFEDVERGDVDLLIVPRGYALKDLPIQTLFEDDWVCVTQANSTDAVEPLSLEQFLKLDHVAKRDNSPNFPSLVENELELLKLKRKIAVRVPFYSMMPLMVMETKRVATVQRRIAETYRQWGLQLAIHPVPFLCNPIEEVMQWHPVKERESSHQWFRGAIESVCQTLTRTVLIK